MSFRHELSIVVVNYHSGDELRRLAESVRLHPIAASHEIILADNSPGDGTAEQLSTSIPGLRVIANSSNVGYARAVNAGIDAAAGEHILVLNPDVELSEGGVDASLNYLREHPECGVLGARLLNADGSVQRSARRFYSLSTILLRRTPLGLFQPNHPALRGHLMLDDDLEAARPVDWVTGAFMLVRRDALERVGPMDGRFFLYFEDVDWCYRMWEAGYECHYLPDASFVHGFKRSSSKGGVTLIHHLKSFVSFYDKWGAMVYVARRLRGAWGTVAAVAGDLLAINLAFLAAFFARRALDPYFSEPLFDLVDYLPLMAFTNALSMILLPLMGRYRQGRSQRRIERVLAAVRTALIVVVLLMAGTYLAHVRTFSRAVMLLFFPALIVSLEWIRLLRERVLAGGERGGGRVRRLALAGGATEAAQLANALRVDRASEVVAGALLPSGARAAAGLRNLGDLAAAPELVERYRIDEVLFAAEGSADAELIAAARELAALGHQVLIQNDWLALSDGDRKLLRYGSNWSRVPSPAACGDAAWTKFLVDWPAGLLLCVLSLPGFVLCLALGWPLGLVRMRRLERLGRRRRHMRWQELVWRRSGAPLAGIVQLPLFLQVLCGRMSMVGPYPLPTGHEEELTPDARLRFTVNPGLSGYWQHHLDASSVRQITLDDLNYLERWSLSLDVDLFLSALPQLLGSRDRWHIPAISS